MKGASRWLPSLARLAAAVLVSALVLWLLAHLTTGRAATENGRRALAVLRNVSLGAAAVYLALGLCQAFLRAWRYRLLIVADGQERAPGWGLTWLVTLTRNMMVDLLPARLGELAYVGMMNQGAGVSGRACVSSLTVSVLFDMVALLGVIAAVAGVSNGHHAELEALGLVDGHQLHRLARLRGRLALARTGIAHALHELQPSYLS